MGSRLLEVDGQLIVSCTKERFLELMCRSGSGVTDVFKIVALRNTSATVLRKSNLKEVEILKEEMSSVINKLDTKIKENKELVLCVQRYVLQESVSLKGLIHPIRANICSFDGIQFA